MSWAAIIASLLEVLGPLLVEWVKQWLHAKLADAARESDPAANLPAEVQVGAVFDEAIAQTPRYARIRRALLRRLKAIAVQKAAGVMSSTVTLSQSEIDEVWELAQAIAETE
jgi:hypothetical protein